MFTRPASARDFPKISPLVTAAFGQRDEALLVDALRADGNIAVEFVATDREKLIGHIVLARMDSPENTLALAPLSVHPDYQRRGIGSALIRAAKGVAEELEWTAIFVLGNPDYYGRFGFEVEAASYFETPFPSEYTAACVFDFEGFRTLNRELTYPKAFRRLPETANRATVWLCDYFC